MFFNNLSWLSVLRTLTQILTAGVSITAFALFLYALAFNLQDRVARSFCFILACVGVIFSSEAIASVSQAVPIIEAWLRLKWMGIVFFPATYLHFSDALLTLTGQPSKGWRRALTISGYAFSFILLALIPTKILVGQISPDIYPFPFLQRTLFTDLFIFYYAIVMLVAVYNLSKAVRRAITRTTKRRLAYLFAGATAPAIATVPFLFHGVSLYSQAPSLFLIVSILGATGVGVFLILMAYSVAFFGVTWTDRVVKSRLFKWLLRGPFTALIALGLTTIIRRIGENFGQPYSAFVPISMVATILLLEYLITLLAPLWEKWLFFGSDRDDISLIRSLEDHMVTKKDLNQFLEIIVATICDRLQVAGSFIAVLNNNTVDYIIKAGDDKIIKDINTEHAVFTSSLKNGENNENPFFRWGELLLMPLFQGTENNGDILLGICGFSWQQDQQMSEEQLDAIKFMGQRASLALKDRQMQQQVLLSLEALQPDVNYIQRLRAISRYDSTGILTADEDLPIEDFNVWVKDALTHFWGGPKLTDSPLLKLKIVDQVLTKHEGNYANALRSILKEAIERVKPDGDRRFTGEWILYNILELKFIEGKKVREIASKLAMSEADLYRKQRIAIESVAKHIIAMERDLQIGPK